MTKPRLRSFEASESDQGEEEVKKPRGHSRSKSRDSGIISQMGNLNLGNLRIEEPVEASSISGSTLQKVSKTNSKVVEGTSALQSVTGSRQPTEREELKLHEENLVEGKFPELRPKDVWTHEIDQIILDQKYKGNWKKVLKKVESYLKKRKPAH